MDDSPIRLSKHVLEVRVSPLLDNPEGLLRIRLVVAPRVLSVELAKVDSDVSQASPEEGGGGESCYCDVSQTSPGGREMLNTLISCWRPLRARHVTLMSRKWAMRASHLTTLMSCYPILGQSKRKNISDDLICGHELIYNNQRWLKLISIGKISMGLLYSRSDRSNGSIV